MSISEPKIRYLADRITRWLAGRDDLDLTGAEDVVASTVARVFREDQEAERALETEVDKVMAGVRRQIESQRLDPVLMRQKIRKQLAKERGIVL